MAVEGRDLGLDSKSTDPNGIAKIVVTNAIATLEDTKNFVEDGQVFVDLFRAIVERLKTGEPFTAAELRDSIEAPVNEFSTALKKGNRNLSRNIATWKRLGERLGRA